MGRSFDKAALAKLTVFLIALELLAEARCRIDAVR
jgi:hypothetical protein